MPYGPHWMAYFGGIFSLQILGRGWSELFSLRILCFSKNSLARENVCENLCVRAGAEGGLMSSGAAMPTKCLAVLSTLPNTHTHTPHAHAHTHTHSVSHYSVIGDTISCDAPYSVIGFRGKF